MTIIPIMTAISFNNEVVIFYHYVHVIRFYFSWSTLKLHYYPWITSTTHFMVLSVVISPLFDVMACENGTFGQ